MSLFAALLWSAADGAGLSLLEGGPEGVAEVRMGAWLLVGPLVLAVATGILVTALLPPALPQPAPVAAEPLEIAPSDRVSWFGRAEAQPSSPGTGGSGWSCCSCFCSSRGRVVLREITGVGVVQVRAGDYGGYGIRSVPGTTAVITRHGPALQIRRENGRTFVITVEDPMAAASVLEGLRRRV